MSPAPRVEVAGKDDINVTHADIAEEHLGHPGASWMAVDSGVLWITESLVEYETYSAKSEADILEATLLRWATTELGHPPQSLAPRDDEWLFD